MSGNVKGGKLTAKIVKAKYGKDFYRKLGQIGGKKSRGGGFTGRPDLAQVAGSKGGKNRMKNAPRCSCGVLIARSSVRNKHEARGHVIS